MLQYSSNVVLCSTILSSLLSNGVDTMNEAVFVHGNVSISCEVSHSDECHWSFVGVDSDPGDPIKIYNGKELVSSNYQINTSMTGQCDLVIQHARIEDAGKYKCETMTERNGHLILTGTAYSQLVVVGSPLLCSHNLSENYVHENQFVGWSCEVAHRGDMLPMLTWYEGNGTTGPGNPVEFVQTNRDRTFGSITREVNSQENKVQLTFTVRFHPRDSHTVQHTANNIPNFYDIWISKPLNVIHGRKIVSICPRQEVYNVGDKLKCTAIADRLPLSYMWKDLTSGETTTGDELIITSNMTGEWKKIQCLVKYRPPNISNSWNAEDEIQFKVTDDSIFSEVEWFIDGNLNSTSLAAGNQLDSNILIIIAIVATCSLLGTILLIISLRRGRKTIKNYVGTVPPGSSEAQLTVSSTYVHRIENNYVDDQRSDVYYEILQDQDLSNSAAEVNLLLSYTGPQATYALPNSNHQLRSV